MEKTQSSSPYSKWDLVPSALFLIGVSALVVGVASVVLPRIKALHSTPPLFGKPVFWASLTAGGSAVTGLALFMMAMSVKNAQIRDLQQQIDNSSSSSSDSSNNNIIIGNENGAEIEKLKKEHDKAKEQLQQQYEQIENNNKGQHAEELERLRVEIDKLKKEHEKTEEQLKQQHREQVEQQNNNYQQQLDDLNKQYKDVVAEQAREFQKLFEERLTKEHRQNEALKKAIIKDKLIPHVNPQQNNDVDVDVDVERASQLATDAVYLLLEAYPNRGPAAFSANFEENIRNGEQESEKTKNLALAMYHRAKERIASGDPKYQKVLEDLKVIGNCQEKDNKAEKHRYDRDRSELENAKAHAEAQGLDFDYLLSNARYHARRRGLSPQGSSPSPFAQSMNLGGLNNIISVSVDADYQPLQKIIGCNDSYGLRSRLYHFGDRVFMLLPTAFGQGAQKQVFYAVDIETLEVAAHAEMLIEIDAQPNECQRKALEEQSKIQTTYEAVKGNPNVLQIYDYSIENAEVNDAAGLKLTTIGRFYALGDLYDHCPVYIDNAPLVRFYTDNDIRQAPTLEQFLFAIRANSEAVKRARADNEPSDSGLQNIKAQIQAGNPFLIDNFFNALKGELGRFADSLELLLKQDKNKAEEIFNAAYNNKNRTYTSKGTIGKREWEYAYKLASALQQLHNGDGPNKEKFSHNDVKPQNCLIGSNQELVLGDLDTMTKLSERNRTLTSYESPARLTELRKNNNLNDYSDRNTASDVFGWAGTIYTMLTGRHILEHAREVQRSLDKDHQYNISDNHLNQDMDYRHYATWLMQSPADRWNAVTVTLVDQAPKGKRELLKVVLEVAAPNSTATMNDVVTRLMAINQEGLNTLIQSEQAAFKKIQTGIQANAWNANTLPGWLEEAKKLQERLERLKTWIGKSDNNNDQIDNGTAEIDSMIQTTQQLIANTKLPSQLAHYCGWFAGHHNSAYNI